MSREVLEFVKKRNPEEVETQLILQCAPFLSGIKPSNLWMIPGASLPQAERLLKGGEISYELLLHTKERAAILMYEKKQLEHYLKQKQVKKILAGLGYETFTLQAVLDGCKGRCRRYMEGLNEFPHELGLLLGYPPEDVEGFIEHKGEDFLYAGYWKVYEDLPAKKQMFQRFEYATQELMQCILMGTDIAEIISGNRKNKLQHAVI